MFNWFKSKPDSSAQPDIRYSHPGVEEFNRKLLLRQNPPPKDRFDAPWSPAKKAPLPAVRHAFDMNSDPLLRLQLMDAGKTESQRREEQTERGSMMVKMEKPFMAHRPPPAQRGNVDRSKFANDWMKEHRAAALRQSTLPQKTAAQNRAPTQILKAPSR